MILLTNALCYECVVYQMYFTVSVCDCSLYCLIASHLPHYMVKKAFFTVLLREILQQFLYKNIASDFFIKVLFIYLFMVWCLYYYNKHTV